MKSKGLLCIFALIFIIGFSCNIFAAPLKAPDFSLLDLNGQKVSLSGLLKTNEKVLLFFWASWCPHCQTALKSLKGQAGNYLLVTINIDEPAERIRRFMGNKGYNFTVLIDEDSQVASAYGILGIPVYMVVEKDASISYRGYGLPEDYLR